MEALFTSVKAPFSSSRPLHPCHCDAFCRRRGGISRGLSHKYPRLTVDSDVCAVVTLWTVERFSHFCCFPLQKCAKMVLTGMFRKRLTSDQSKSRGERRKRPFSRRAWRREAQETKIATSDDEAQRIEALQVQASTSSTTLVTRSSSSMADTEDAVAAADKQMEERAARAKALLAQRYTGLRTDQVRYRSFFLSETHESTSPLLLYRKNDMNVK